MVDLILNDGKTKETAIIINGGHREDLNCIDPILDKIKEENGADYYTLTDHIVETDEYKYENHFIYYTFYKKNELQQRIDAIQDVWFDATGPLTDYD